MSRTKRNASPAVSIPSMENIESERRRISYRSRYGRTLRSTVAVLIVAAAVAILVATLWMPVLQIYGTSMQPILENGDIVVSIKGADFETGELVAFYYGNKLLVKRVICGPGDYIDIDADGEVYINGSRLDEPYLAEKALGECTIDLPFQVPDERWFVMGDNRAVSVDSRAAQMGCVSNEQIVGRIVFRVWPFNAFGRVD